MNLCSKEKKRDLIYYDSQISPSAVNLDFFTQVDKLSPFGSGNPEPKFLLEDVKILNSKL